MAPTTCGVVGAGSVVLVLGMPTFPHDLVMVAVVPAASVVHFLLVSLDHLTMVGVAMVIAADHGLLGRRRRRMEHDAESGYGQHQDADLKRPEHFHLPPNFQRLL